MKTLLSAATIIVKVVSSLFEMAKTNGNVLRQDGLIKKMLKISLEIIQQRDFWMLIIKNKKKRLHHLTMDCVIFINDHSNYVSELPRDKCPFRGHPMFEGMLKYFKQRPMRVRRECKLQNFINFLTVLILFKISQGAFYHLSKMSHQGQIFPGAWL